MQAKQRFKNVKFFYKSIHSVTYRSGAVAPRCPKKFGTIYWKKPTTASFSNKVADLDLQIY